MNNLFLKDLHKMIDVSCVKSSSTLEEINQMITAAKRYRFICAFALPSFSPYLVEQLKDEPDIMIGGVVGYPSGGDTTNAKVFQAQELLKIGCNELDMVINIGQLKSQQYDAVYNDIKAVVNEANGTPVKAIIEVTLLTDEEIVKASRIAVDAGVSYVKTGTGWMPKPTTVSHIKLIKGAVQDNAKIKAAGGIRDLDTIMEMAANGCSRFGIGLSSAINIIEQAKKYEKIC